MAAARSGRLRSLRRAALGALALAAYAAWSLVALRELRPEPRARARAHAAASPRPAAAGAAGAAAAARPAPPAPPPRARANASASAGAAPPACCELLPGRTLTPAEVRRLDDGLLPVTILQALGSGGGGRAKAGGAVPCDVPCELAFPPLPASARALDVVLATSVGGAVPEMPRGAAALRGAKALAVSSMESPVYYANLGTRALRARGLASATTSRDSDVPVTYMRASSVRSWGARPAAWDAARVRAASAAGSGWGVISLVASNCGARSGRDAFFAQLRDALGGRAESLGRCGRTAAWPEDCPRKPPATGLGACSKHGALRRYPFYLAAENSVAADYVTEKAFDALEAGVVPVYLGAPNAREFLPPGSAVFVDDFGSNASALAAHLLWLLAEPEGRYGALLAWKRAPLERAYARRWGPLVLTKMHCRLCRWAYWRRHADAGNVSWDAAEQQLVLPPLVGSS